MEPIRIVVLQRGWVVIGKWQRDGSAVEISDAYVIRKWGTTRGLGQLALEGPTEETILDFAGTVRLHELSVVCSFDVIAEKWSQWCQSQKLTW